MQTCAKLAEFRIIAWASRWYLSMDIVKMQDWADLVLKVVSAVAIVTGGVWAYFQYDITRTSIDNIQLTVSTEQLPYAVDRRLLLVHVRPKNIGKVVTSPGQGGIVVSVWQIPADVKSGVIELEKGTQIFKQDLMKRFPEGYELEPGVEYDEVVAIVVPTKSSYAAKATLDLGEDEVDHTTVVRVE